jgi:hypothetical protein
MTDPVELLLLLLSSLIEANGAKFGTLKSSSVSAVVSLLLEEMLLLQQSVLVTTSGVVAVVVGIFLAATNACQTGPRTVSTGLRMSL